MARFTSLGMRRPPRESDYSSDAAGGLRYTTDALEWIQDYVDATDDHRKDSFDTVADTIADHELSLAPVTSKNPGWVANAIEDIRAVQHRFAQQVAEDNQALVDDNKAIRSELKYMRGLAVSALIAMLIFFGQQLYVRL